MSALLLPCLCLLFSVEHDKSNYTFKLRYTILSPSFFFPSRHRFYALHFFPLLYSYIYIYMCVFLVYPSFQIFRYLATISFHPHFVSSPIPVDLQKKERKERRKPRNAVRPMFVSAFVPARSPRFLPSFVSHCHRLLFSPPSPCVFKRSTLVPSFFLPTFVSTDVSCAYRVDLSVSFLHSFVSRDS